MSDSLQPHELQHARPPCPTPTPGAYPNSCPSSWSSSNCCFLTCIQVSQEAGQVVWYSHLFQLIVIHTVKGFSIVNKAEIDVFLELSSFFDDPADVSNLISGSSAFSKTSLNIWKFSVLLNKYFTLLFRQLFLLPLKHLGYSFFIIISFWSHSYGAFLLP